jgi:hypothetical protein
MKASLLFAWLVGEGIVSWRSVKQNGHAPMPGELLATSGVFVLLAVMSEFGTGAASLAVLLGAGYDIAAAMNILGTVKSDAQGNPVSTVSSKKTQVV